MQYTLTFAKGLRQGNHLRASQKSRTCSVRGRTDTRKRVRKGFCALPDEAAESPRPVLEVAMQGGWYRELERSSPSLHGYQRLIDN